MEEMLPPELQEALYEVWAEAGWGMVVTGAHTLSLYSGCAQLTRRGPSRQRPSLASAPRHPTRHRHPSSTRAPRGPRVLVALGPLNAPDLVPRSPTRHPPAQPPGPAVDALRLRPLALVPRARTLGRAAQRRRPARSRPVGHPARHDRAGLGRGRRGVCQRREGRQGDGVGRRAAACEPRIPAGVLPVPEGPSRPLLLPSFATCWGSGRLIEVSAVRAGQPPHRRLRGLGAQTPRPPLPHRRRHTRRVSAE